MFSSVYPIQAPGSSGTKHVHARCVTGNQLLRFDWVWIAAARQVIEHNLRNSLKSDRHRDVLRAGWGSRSLHLGWASSRATTDGRSRTRRGETALV